VTSTGFLTPGLSALLIRELGVHLGCARGDIVGMGCNAGLKALNLDAAWSVAHPAGLRRTGVEHWLVHLGGKKVIDASRSTSG
jgi:predicted naringenin-chalcone synthase